jgi:hypothetical protein
VGGIIPAASSAATVGETTFDSLKIADITFGGRPSGASALIN